MTLKDYTNLEEKGKIKIPVKDKSQTLYGNPVNSDDIVFHTEDHDYKYVEFNVDEDEDGTLYDTIPFCTYCERDLNPVEIERL